MKCVSFVALLALFVIGCGPDPAKVAAAKKNLDDTVKEIDATLNWKTDVAVAEGLFDIRTRSGFDRYQAFLKCHDEPPTRDANKKACASIQKQVADARKKAEAQQNREKAAW